MTRGATSSPSDAVTTASAIVLPSRRDPAVASIARTWRELTSGRTRDSGRRLGPGEHTLVACSGGADSSALAIALAAVTSKITLAHVVHDMRPPAEAFADRDAVKTLASHLRVGYLEAAVSVRPDRRREAGEPPAPACRLASAANVEDIARRRRYAALARLAQDAGIEFIATAHQAQDQLESLLMRIMRGAGPSGLCGVRQRRLLTRAAQSTPAIWLIRPMLHVSRADSERLCAAAGWCWQQDATNADTARLRSALRARVVPELLAIAPGCDRRASRAADLLADLSAHASRAAGRLDRAARRGVPQPPGSIVWSREVLSQATPMLVGAVLRLGMQRLALDERADRRTHRGLRQIVDTVLDGSPKPRRGCIAGIESLVSSTHVQINRELPS
ncbi:MAG: tRNA lysidine(34) synthetase TilS [Phycisphaerales bacterium]